MIDTPLRRYGPVGARIRSGYWNEVYRVLSHNPDGTVTVKWEKDGRTTTHMTLFDRRRDVILCDKCGGDCHRTEILWRRTCDSCLREIESQRALDELRERLTSKGVSVYDVAVAHGAHAVDGSINMGEFTRLGLPFFSGCQTCGASLAPYNAYPSKTGFIRCGDCIGDLGFATVGDLDKYEVRV